MGLYTKAQRQIAEWLRDLKIDDLDKLKELSRACQATHTQYINWEKYLADLGFSNIHSEDFEHAELHALVQEQIDASGEEILIRNLRGLPLPERTTTGDREVWLNNRAGWWLRLAQFSQVGALQIGDRLISSQKVLSVPRDGGNAIVLVQLSRDDEDRWGYWNEYPGDAVLVLA